MENVKEEIKRLEGIKKKVVKRIKAAPKGTLHVSCTARQVFYKQHLHKSGCKPEDIYLNRKKRGVAEALAQKEYDQKILVLLNTKIASLQGLAREYEENSFEKVYDGESAPRKNLIISLEKELENSIDEWCKEDYESNDHDFGVDEIITRRGERVRSKSEKIIADTLDEFNIPYKYEKVLYLKDGMHSVYPDFTIKRRKDGEIVIWEHFGLMDDPEYADKAVKKLLQYEKNGFILGKNLIITYETANCPLNDIILRQTIKRILL